MKIIDGAVGGSAQASSPDVARIEELLTLAGYGAPVGARGMPVGAAVGSGAGGPQSTVDGLTARIWRFQEEVVGLRSPDGRIDPGGTTLARLVAEARKQVHLVHRASRSFSDPLVTEAIHGEGLPVVTKGNIQKPALIAARTIGALQLLGYCCGLKGMHITEGIRTYEMMAQYFLTGVTTGSRGVRGQSYWHAKELLKKHNKGLPYARGKAPAEHVKAVADRMRAACAKANTRVSMHVVTEREYATLNVIDLGYNSNPLLKEVKRARLFAALLDDFHVKNPRAVHPFIRTYHPPHYLNAHLDSPYGRELSVERAWHVEFVVADIPEVLA